MTVHLWCHTSLCYNNHLLQNYHTKKYKTSIQEKKLVLEWTTTKILDYRYVPLGDSGVIKFGPLDWRTTINWNVVLDIFQHSVVCQDCVKNTRVTFECKVILQSRGQGPDSCWKYGTDLSCCSPIFLDLVPWIWE